MEELLSQSAGRGFCCACSTCWVWKPKHGLLATWVEPFAEEVFLG